MATGVRPRTGEHALGPELVFLQDKPTHGVVAPASPMTLREFQEALALTQGRWIKIAD
jgi:hypothetical protein